jgi:mitogen-activated protein kinase organizer 1
MLSKQFMSEGISSSPAPSMAVSGRMISVWASSVKTTLDVRFYSLFEYRLANHCLDPVTAVIPTQDAQSYLATTLDGHARLMDSATGKMLNDFSGHTNESYRCRAVFGHGEASVVCGDEEGRVWAWDLLDVSSLYQ